MPMTNNVNGDTRNYGSDSSGINGSPLYAWDHTTPYPELSHFQFKASYEEEKHYSQCRAKESEAREDERL